MMDNDDRGLEVVFGPPGRDPVRPPSGRRRTALLAVAGLAVILLAGALYLNLRPSATEQAATRTIAAYTAAWNAHNRAAVLAVMAPGASFAAGESLEHPLLTASAGPELDRLLGSLFEASVSLRTTGRLTVVGADAPRASVAQRYRYEVHGVRVVEDGVSLFTMVRVAGTLKIAQHVWWRPRAATTPSMLWAT